MGNYLCLDILATVLVNHGNFFFKCVCVHVETGCFCGLLFTVENAVNECNIGKTNYEDVAST